MDNYIATTLGANSVNFPWQIVSAGASTQRCYLEFFTAEIRNPNTRAAYRQAARQFFSWIETFGLDLGRVEPVHAATYIEQLGRERGVLTVKQHLAALRRLFDYLVVGQAATTNPFKPVKGPRYSLQEGKTPILSADETRGLLSSFDVRTVAGARDRAIVATMVYSLARVSAVTKMRVRDYVRQSARAWFVLDEKGGKQRKIPAHHAAAEAVEYYIDLAGIRDLYDGYLFCTLIRRGKVLTDRQLLRANVFHMIRRRLRDAGFSPECRIGCHSFRGTGITNFLENGGTLETAARIAGHASTTTTQLYDRRLQQVDQGEIERIRF